MASKSFAQLVSALRTALVLGMLVTSLPAVSKTGTVQVNVRVSTGALPLIDSAPVREEMAQAVAAHLAERYNNHWRFETGPIEPGDHAFRLHVENGNSAGEIRIRLEPLGMNVASGAERWIFTWYEPGELAVGTPPTPRNGPKLLTDALSQLLDEYGEAIGETLKSVPVGIGASWHPADEQLMILGLPWKRFQGSQALFRINCAFELESGVTVPVELYTAALGIKATFPNNGGPFEALVAAPQYRVRTGKCKPVDEVMEEVHQFEMQEILLEAEQQTSLMGIGPDC